MSPNKFDEQRSLWATHTAVLHANTAPINSCAHYSPGPACVSASHSHSGYRISEFSRTATPITCLTWLRSPHCIASPSLHESLRRPSQIVPFVSFMHGRSHTSHNIRSNTQNIAPRWPNAVQQHNKVPHYSTPMHHHALGVKSAPRSPRPHDRDASLPTTTSLSLATASSTCVTFSTCHTRPFKRRSASASFRTVHACRLVHGACGGTTTRVNRQASSNVHKMHNGHEKK